MELIREPFARRDRDRIAGTHTHTHTRERVYECDLFDCYTTDIRLHRSNNDMSLCC